MVIHLGLDGQAEMGMQGPGERLRTRWCQDHTGSRQIPGARTAWVAPPVSETADRENLRVGAAAAPWIVPQGTGLEAMC